MSCSECSSFWISAGLVSAVRPLDVWYLNILAVFALLVPVQLTTSVRAYMSAATYKLLQQEENSFSGGINDHRDHG